MQDGIVCNHTLSGLDLVFALIVLSILNLPEVDGPRLGPRKP